ncbi:MAG TPA: TAT-variant-translocated molybdopterin oxidoreductase [Pyrinomonadaceae bacterium]|jgi:molybdopterin-containing oxidoreductase family iron-sulfur binding subunit
MPSKESQTNFALMRERILATQDGKEYWRSLEELADTDEFQEFLAREYPQQAEEWHDAVGRRTFLKLMGASLALAGLSNCTYQPPELIVPYVRQPEAEVPGKPLYFATAMTLSGVATGLLAKSNEGRPTKLEGNPDHPGSRGATDHFAQASLLTLYDPDRSQTLTFREEIRPWTEFLANLRTALDEQRGKQGAGLRFLTETVTSPTLAAQLKEILTAFPQAKWHQYEPAGRGLVNAGAQLAFGQPVNTIYRFDQARRILAIDSDFLSCVAGSLPYATGFIGGRRADESRDMNRLYAVETTPTNTGAKADHRLRLRPSEIENFTRAVAAALGVNMGSAGQAQAAGAHANWVAALARDLLAARGASIVIPGDEQSPVVHALAHAMNDALGNVGKTVIYTEPIEANPVDSIQSLRELVGDIDAGRVEMLVIVGGNPVYTTPADLKLDLNRLSKVKLRVHLSLYKDETSEICHWHIPEAHYLESWSDARAYDGTVTIIQPLIEPLYNGKTAHELLAAFSDQFDRKSYQIVRDYWMGQMGGKGVVSGERQAGSTQASNPSGDFEERWRKALHDGVVPNTAAATKTVSLKADWASQPPVPAPQPSTLEIVFRADPTIYDGRFANNGWLQELPKPLTKLTWDNAALVSPKTARDLGINNEMGSKGGNIFVDAVDLKYRDRVVRAPVWIMPGQPDGTVTVHLGYGRTRAGRAGTSTAAKPIGFNAYAIRTSDAPWFGTGVELHKTGTQYQLAATQTHFNMENRKVVRTKSLVDYLKESEGEHREAMEHDEPGYNDSMYPPYDYKNQGLGYAWGMAIDLNNCVGCNACIVACQSENNIPVVGKEQVIRSREMHWLRVDAYFGGADANNPEGPYFQPVPCMHCEQAPCEPVCPVHATVHSTEGTNDMVYNRCVGTRYCSNNCPYKVRRFNFLLYQDWTTPTYQLMRNPEVTVRSRGVMEKCTYCIQRIQLAKIESEKEGRSVRDGDIVTACQAVCPTQAIVFGNINDQESQVAKLKAGKRNYSLLEDLNTQPRTTYLAELRNPNPEIPERA